MKEHKSISENISSALSEMDEKNREGVITLAVITGGIFLFTFGIYIGWALGSS